MGAMETGYQRSKIQEESMLYETLKHSGALPLIGVNTFRSKEGEAVSMTGNVELSRATEQEKRSQLAIQMFHEFGCDGIVGEKMVFCDQWNVEHYLLGADLKEAGIPFLSLERSYVTEGTGQLKTRVQAFIETMGK